MKDIEHCWFIYGIWMGPFFVGCRVYHSMGSISSVDFDWKKAFKSSLIGWSHTHPHGDEELSVTDHQTMRSWVKATNKSYLCNIIITSNNSGKEIEFPYMFFRYEGDVYYCSPVCRRIGKWIFGYKNHGIWVRSTCGLE